MIITSVHSNFSAREKFTLRANIHKQREAACGCLTTVVCLVLNVHSLVFVAFLSSSSSPPRAPLVLPALPGSRMSHHGPALLSFVCLVLCGLSEEPTTRSSSRSRFSSSPRRWQLSKATGLSSLGIFLLTCQHVRWSLQVRQYMYYRCFTAFCVSSNLACATLCG